MQCKARRLDSTLLPSLGDLSAEPGGCLTQPLTPQCTFSLFSPIGIAIGIALTETVSREEDVQSPGVIALQGLATGTLLYVVFFELLEKERQKKGVNSLIQVSGPNLRRFVTPRRLSLKLR